MRVRVAARVGRLEAEHERRRERPRLRGDVAGVGDRDARLLADLALDGLLEALPRLDEPGEAGEPPLGPVRVAPEQDAVAVDHERDDDRVGARVVLRAAVRARRT